MSDPRPETSLDDTPRHAGTAPVRAEYLIRATPIVESTSAADLNDIHPADAAKGHTPSDSRDSRDGGDSRDSKRRKPNKADKKERKGQNKGRKFAIVREASVRICRAWETTGECERGEGCKFKHSWEGYFEVKPADIGYRPEWEKRDEPPYVRLGERLVGGEDALGKTLDLNTVCPVYKDLGYCPFGWRCRFLGGHINKVDPAKEEQKGGPQKRMGEWQVEGWEQSELNEEGWKQGETNWPEFENLQNLRHSTAAFPFSTAYLAHVDPEKPFTLGDRNDSRNKPQKRKKTVVLDEEEAANEVEGDEEAQNQVEEVKGYVLGESESFDVPMRPEEKRRLNWEGGRYLAPLTTVGNLPFRRLCVDYGATITISEMALAQPLVYGAKEEWALVRRHASEKMFGVQLAGGFPNRMVPAAEVLAREVGSGVDFVDVNMGCPIDLVFNQGAGTALMDSPGRLGKILVGMNRALGEIPLTVKFRTGVAHGKPNAHKLIPRFATEWGASALTLHGRSRQQRYSKPADWDYIKSAVTTLRESVADANLPPVPIFGNGDCFSAAGYYEEMERSGVDGVMVARGALIKPWIFTEIKERREWDISAVERLEGIRKFAEFGLSHWGSDTQGVNITRRFLCEALSFQHRYIPIGLLERLPAKMNERPPAYRGRNELETLLASPFVGDWVKISEMFLGRVDEGFEFVPKHKSNAYGGEEAQG
ncbi:tRNA-dihydrouridine(47) synthase [NAD(P)(+)] [Cryptococcus wingfieldii CBS 7118]|uniref:tRNA-dihydrouridine(47) synthase [NAD(P)(+)] n=1 Tax=Cryptococcus wingfieldii CBS 7118 TaxID=1295528 RepID=A0A1E3K5Z2_9TREE|nr:tRNA-dihydrouridine(47) synthase [NAD(P)(+)] [Cryptococcus wingfieldii CBS 7118]ODO08283.1 tRNA-dihydrouridine(47) synthase [NAD(P)(+)] [Cryptococcus wingfieldii CBS 7118]